VENRVADEDDIGFPRFAHRGRAFVYVLPCRDEDLVKVGFSHDPLERMRTLHPRCFDVFDLDRAFLIATDTVREARRIERLFITRFAARRSPAPLVVRDAAAGYTEWFRGIYPDANALARQIAESEGLAMHAPLGDWLRRRFEERAGLLYAWSARMLEAIEYERFNAAAPANPGALERALRDTLDGFDALGIAIEPLVPDAVSAWYRAG
jgi:Meiotically up-regulated gene 113